MRKKGTQQGSRRFDLDLDREVRMPKQEWDELQVVNICLGQTDR